MSVIFTGAEMMNVFVNCYYGQVLLDAVSNDGIFQFSFSITNLIESSMVKIHLPPSKFHGSHFRVCRIKKSKKNPSVCPPYEALFIVILNQNSPKLVYRLSQTSSWSSTLGV